MKFLFMSIACGMMIILGACNKDRTDDDMPSVVEYDATPYSLEYGTLPKPQLPRDNALTQQVVTLGRMLFYEPKLSADESISCASCHLQEEGFSDSRQFSLGVNSLVGKRQAMPVFNLAWNDLGFFWDGRADLLRHQALQPIQDPLEMAERLDQVVTKLESEQLYLDQFVRAFGDSSIDTTRIALALEQFMLTIVSYRSPYDDFLEGNYDLSESEERGKALFEGEFNPHFPEASGADCFHCHGGSTFETDRFANNGLEAEGEWKDLGRFIVTGEESDKGVFKTPTLRNIAITPPYMHDGRFGTLEEVIRHYNNGVKESSTLSDELDFIRVSGGLGLSDQDITDIVNYLKTLTDPNLLTDTLYTSPF